jgi:triacylglycerol esterase/lipase EstA (alpha/beta hydrolase family)
MSKNNFRKTQSIVTVVLMFLSVSCRTISTPVNGDITADTEIAAGENIAVPIASDNTVQLKYPIVLVHGAGFRDKTLGFINYWGRIPKHLEKNGVTVYYGGTDAWGSIEENAEILKNRILRILQEEDLEKVNIIAHSRGGLEARYLISALEMEEYVASLTTISTSHRGVKAMNTVVKIPDGLYKIPSFFERILLKAVIHGKAECGIKPCLIAFTLAFKPV